MRSRQIALLVVASCVLAAPAAARAADTCVNPGGTSGCFATVQAAIDAAQTVDGDTITIAPGTYTGDSQIIVNKGVRIVGAGPGQTTIDGGDAAGPVATGLFRILAADDDVLLSGMTLRNPPATGSSRSAVGIKGVGVLGRTYRLSNLEIIGENVNFDNAIYADNSDAALVIEESTISNTGGNPILIERHRSTLDIRDNDLLGPVGGTAIYLMSHSGDRVTALQQIRDNRIQSNTTGISVNGAGPAAGGTTEGGFRNVAISGNTISSGASGVTINNNASGDGALGRIQGVSVRGNRLTGTLAAGSDGVRLRGGVIGTSIVGNDISGYTTGLRVLPSAAPATHSPSGTAASFNRIVGNTNGTENTTATAVDAENNWWGCNEGPGTVDCDTAPGGALVDADPWLVFGASAAPGSILTGGATSTITAGPVDNSDGATPGGNAFPDGVPVAFATTLGSIAASANTVAGAAQAALTSGAADGTANVTAALDAASASTPVAFTLPPPPATVTERVIVPGPPAPTTLTVAGSANSLQAGGLSIAVPDETEVFRSGRFIVRASITGGGLLLARGTATFGEAAAITRLAGRSFSVLRSEDVRVKLRVSRAVRRALNRGRRVSARVTMTLTPRSGAASVTRTARLRLVKR